MRTLRAAASMAVFSLATVATAQGPLAQPGFVAGGPGALAGAGHAAFGAPVARADAFVDAHGNPLVMPAQYHGAVAGGGGYGGGCYSGGPAGCYGGCDSYGYGYGGGADAPWGGYMNTEQCGPHYFDFSAEYLHYKRDEQSFSNSTVYSGVGFATDDNTIVDPPQGGQTPYFPGQVALRGGDVNSDNGDGYRLTGRFDVGALSVVEFTYSGMYWEDEAVRTEAGQPGLFSVYSLYGSGTNGDWDQNGTAGPPSGTALGTPFLATDNAYQHRLDYQSELHTTEASYRRYWVGFNPRVSGTLLVGFRYTNLQEEMSLTSFSNVGSPLRRESIVIGADADNDLAGAQVGGDAWVTLLQGFRVGGETKVGLYNNNYKVRNTVAASDPTFNNIQTLIDGDQASFMWEAKLMAVADITPSWSLKAGYELLLITNVATIGDSLATAQPYGDINNIAGGLATALPAGVGPQVGASDDDKAFFHGFSAGVEYVW